MHHLDAGPSILDIENLKNFADWRRSERKILPVKELSPVDGPREYRRSPPGLSAKARPHCDQQLLVAPGVDERAKLVIHLMV